MKKAIKLLILALTVLFTTLLFTGCGEMELEYLLLEDDTYEVRLGSTAFPSKVIIPETYRGKPVTVLGHSGDAPVDAKVVQIPPTIKSATKITLSRFVNAKEYEDGITYVCNWAIDCERGITNIKIREGTIGIAGDFLENNPQATSIECPSSLRYLGRYAFDYGYNLTSVKLNDGLQYIGYGAFSRNTFLRTIVIPDTVTTMSAGVFWDCAKLERVVLPTSITKVYEDTFYGCPDNLVFFYKGMEYDFEKIVTEESTFGVPIQSFSRVYFSPERPQAGLDKYWFMLDGYPTLWSEY